MERKTKSGAGLPPPRFVGIERGQREVCIYRILTIFASGDH